MMGVWDHIPPDELGGWHPWICDQCGYRVNGGAHFEDGREHECDPRSVIRVQTERLEESWAAFLESPAGKFEQFDAQRKLRRAA